MGIFGKILQIFKRLWPSMPRCSRLVPGDDGFSIVSPDGSCCGRLRFSEVKEIYAYKSDVFSYDLICVGFRVSDNDEVLEINEDMPGYQQIMTLVYNHFDLDCSGLSNVMFPPFKRCLTHIWGEATLYNKLTQK